MTSRNDAATSILCPSHYQMLTEGSGIIEAVIDTRGYFTATKKTQLKALGFTTSQIRVPALVIPVHNVHGEIATYQARPDQPRINKGKAIKYETCFGKSMVLDVPPSSRQYLGDPNKPLFVTEGIKKGDALASHGCCVVALLGVWNWRGTNHHGGKVALPDWEQVALNNRRVYIVFDSDVMTKTQVHHALARLKMFLESRGAQVELIYLPTKDDGAG
jgi:hypothetical protein